MPSDLEERAEKAARLRAARGYAGLTQRQLAKELGHGYSVETLSRIENGRTEITAEHIDNYLRVCSTVPRAFMDVGFQPIIDAARAPVAVDVLRRVSSLEVQVNQLVARDARRELEARQQIGEAPEPTIPPHEQQRPAKPTAPSQSDEDRPAA